MSELIDLLKRNDSINCYGRTSDRNIVLSDKDYKRALVLIEELEKESNKWTIT